MPRLPRIVVPGYPHHVIQRGSRRMKVFFSSADRTAYLAHLRKACDRCGVDILAWCLMDNHIHCIAVPKKQDSLARCFSQAHGTYAHRVNRREGWTGHLWQARFGSSVLDEPHVVAAARYVERNPVRAGIAELPWRYQWSSARWHTGRVMTDPLIENDGLLRDLIDNWERYLLEEDEEDFAKQVRKEALVNRPIGDERFIQHLEGRLKTSLIRKKSGRVPLGE